MPAGGTWKAQNKRRPGAYINFVSVPRAVSNLGNRGVVAVALPMTWGAENTLIKLTGDELISGASLSKIGCTAADTEASLPYRLALAGCFTALLYRSDAGATKANANLQVDSLVASAKYPGTTGNRIRLAVVKDKPAVGTFEVQVLVDGILQETHYVKTMADFGEIDSAWVRFGVTNPATAIVANAGIALTGATNGTVSTANYTKFFELLDTAQFQVATLNSVAPEAFTALEAKIKIMRENRGKKVQCVSYDHHQADYEGVISVSQGFTTPVDNVTTDLFPLYVASITAGAQVNESNTCRVIQDATTIINPIAEDEIADALALGKFVLSYRQDGAVVVEQDINTLHTFTVDKGYAFSKNRVIRCLDELGNVASLTFATNYQGKVNNDSVGRNLFKMELISIIDRLVNIGAVTNFGGAADVTILPGESVDSVVVDLTIQPVDSMEKLYMTVNVDA